MTYTELIKYKEYCEKIIKQYKEKELIKVNQSATLLWLKEAHRNLYRVVFIYKNITNIIIKENTQKDMDFSFEDIKDTGKDYKTIYYFAEKKDLIRLGLIEKLFFQSNCKADVINLINLSEEDFNIKMQINKIQNI